MIFTTIARAACGNVMALAMAQGSVPQNIATTDAVVAVIAPRLSRKDQAGINRSVQHCPDPSFLTSTFIFHADTQSRSVGIYISRSPLGTGANR